MRLFTPTQSRRLNEATGFLFLAAGILVLLSFASFHPSDASLNTATGASQTGILIGPIGAYMSDLFLQSFGLAAFAFPVLMFALGWRWIRSEPLPAPAVKLLGSAIIVISLCGMAALLPDWRLFDKTIPPGGAAGFLIAGLLRHGLNLAGATVVLATSFIISIYLVSKFSLASLENLFSPIARFFAGIQARWRRYLENKREAALVSRQAIVPEPTPAAAPASDPATTRRIVPADPVPASVSETLPWDEPEPILAPVNQAVATPPPTLGEIPICRLDQTEESPANNILEFPFTKPKVKISAQKLPTLYRLPSTELLNEIPVRSAFDEQELKNTAAAIKAKFEEFHVLGSVVQINPGPVVTTFEFKPEAGIKYSKITTLTEDLCLGLQAESILIERIPGKPTIGIEVPNVKREVISLRAVLKIARIRDPPPSHMTFPLGKDISRYASRVAAAPRNCTAPAPSGSHRLGKSV